MPKTDGYKTKAKILEVAEQLFSEKGFNGTSIDKIAKAAGVNKGLIYYHFKDKKDIIGSILQQMITEVDQVVQLSPANEAEVLNDELLQQKIKAEIEYCKKQKRIITVMLMEALKKDGNSDFLFKCSELVIQQELDGIKKKIQKLDKEDLELQKRYLVHEFFTGFIPIVAFVALQDKWSEYFGCDKDKALEYFLDSFTQTHLKSHLG